MKSQAGACKMCEKSIYSICALGRPLEHGAWCAVHVGGQQTITYNFRAFCSGARRHALNWLSRHPLWSALFIYPTMSVEGVRA